jgi:GDP-L-fucose synthase
MLPLNTKIFIAGHKGMVGSAVWRKLERLGYTDLIGVGRKELDLRSQAEVKNFVKTHKPKVIIDAAATVGGILANASYPYQFLMDNLQIQNNLIQSALELDVEKFIFLGSSCIYPKMAHQPIRENALLTGLLEPTNEAYAIAKIAGVKACQAIKEQFGKDFTALMPTNLYGPKDNFDTESSHVLPAMIRKFHDAKLKNEAVELWGSGNPLREFLHVDDLADAIVFSLNQTLPEYLYNVGSGSEISIRQLAEVVKETVGYQGEIAWNTSKPDGTPRKLMDSSRFRSLGWEPQINLKEGIQKTYSWFLDHLQTIKEVKFQSAIEKK